MLALVVVVTDRNNIQGPVHPRAAGPEHQPAPQRHGAHHRSGAGGTLRYARSPLGGHTPEPRDEEAVSSVEAGDAAAAAAAAAPPVSSTGGAVVSPFMSASTPAAAAAAEAEQVGVFLKL